MRQRHQKAIFSIKFQSQQPLGITSYCFYAILTSLSSSIRIFNNILWVNWSIFYEKRMAHVFISITMLRISFLGLSPHPSGNSWAFDPPPPRNFQSPRGGGMDIFWNYTIQKPWKIRRNIWESGQKVRILKNCHTFLVIFQGFEIAVICSILHQFSSNFGL